MVISVEKCQKYFPVSKGVVARKTIGHVKAVDGNDLQLREAEQLALDLDPLSKGFVTRSEAYSEESIAEGQLPDPTLTLGTESLPVDEFGIDEPMTQFQIGLQQAFPPGQTLRYKREYAEALSDVEVARSEERALRVLRDVRLRFLEVYYRSQSTKILQQYRDLFAELFEITQKQYAAGRDNQHEVLRAQLELSLVVEDRILEAIMMRDAASGELARLLTVEHSGRPLADAFPELQSLPDKPLLQERMLAHPLIRIEDAALLASKKKIGEAEQQYKPGYSVDVTYGIRPGDDMDGRGLPNMLTAMVMVDLPLFTGKRQDKRLSAAAL
ncbi:MAG: Cu(I)/Ag(I) efflux system outer rane protein CusC [Gammaproteobacteria bacterium]|nr:Cu(I)/Ag(I) efflux system outer rane protein CusC [Gammaproteobacteria bacterium]